QRAQVFEGAALDDDGALDTRLAEPGVDQRPPREDGNGGQAAAENRVAVVDVGSEGGGQAYPTRPDVPHGDLHRPRDGDVGVQVPFDRPGVARVGGAGHPPIPPGPSGSRGSSWAGGTCSSSLEGSSGAGGGSCPGRSRRAAGFTRARSSALSSRGASGVRPG